jgi:DHA2 family methylenomycin A resistance protein-like MFS transporter
VLAPFGGRLVAAAGPRRPAGWGLILCGCAYLGVAAVGSDLTAPDGLVLLFLAGVGMAVATPALVAGATEALGENRAGIASAINNTSRQVGGAIGVALIGGFSSFSTSLGAAGAALILGGSVALALMGPAGAAALRPILR